MGISNKIIPALLRESQNHFQPRRVLKAKTATKLPLRVVRQFQEIRDSISAQTRSESPEAQPPIPSGSDRLGPAPTRIVRLSLTESQAEKMGIGEHWRKADARWQKRQAARSARETAVSDAVALLRSSAGQILEIAQKEDWSLREAARKSGLSWGAFRRCLDGENNPFVWLPKVQAALDRVLKAKH